MNHWLSVCGSISVCVLMIRGYKHQSLLLSSITLIRVLLFFGLVILSLSRAHVFLVDGGDCGIRFVLLLFIFLKVLIVMEDD